MSMSLQDVESWLPSEFLTEDELLMDKDDFNKHGPLLNPSMNFPTEFPYEFDPFGTSSALSSPVESVVGSTETESSDDDDFLAGLTRRLTQQLAVKPEKSKWVMAGSPESTLSGIGSWSVSSEGSPNGALSPPATPFEVKNDTWDLIYEAAGQVARLKMSSEGHKFNNCGSRGLFGPVRTQNPDAIFRNQNARLYADQSRYDHGFLKINQYQNRAAQEQALRQQCSSIWANQPAKSGFQAEQKHVHQLQQIQNRARIIGCENGKSMRPLGLPQSAWPPLQGQPSQRQHMHSNSGMRAVFLNGSVKRESTGTGVFLPRRYGSLPDCKKKQVLLPAKVVQALNLNFDDAGSNGHSQHRYGSGFRSEYDAVLMARKNALLAQQRRGLRPEGALNHDLRLPQEWTY